MTFDSKGFLITAITMIALLLAIASCGQSVPENKKDNDDGVIANEIRPNYFQVEVPESSPFRGDVAAPVTIVTFGDFQAPRSPGNARALKKLAKRFEGKLRVVYRADPQPKYPDSMRAETAARAAAKQGKFWEMHDALFEQGKLGDANITAAAKVAGCDVEKLRRDMEAPVIATEIASDRQYALNLGITSVPMNFVNGRPLAPIAFADDAASLIKEELARATRLFPASAKTTNIYEKIVAKGLKKLPGTNRTKQRRLDPNARYNVPIWADDIVIGKEDARVTIVAFVDLECPFSAETSTALRKLQARFKKSMRLVFKHSPLPSHSNAEIAAEALVEAHKQGKATKFHTLMIDEINDLSPGNLLKVGEEILMDTISLGAALADRRHAPRVQKDRNLVLKLNIKDTPCLFINGKMIRGSKSFDQLAVIIGKELKYLASLKEVAPLAGNKVIPTLYERLTADGATAPVYLSLDTTLSTYDLVNDGKYRVYNIALPGNAPVLGDLDAPFTIIEFGDYQCKMCASIRSRIDEILKEMKGQARLVFMHYPLRGHEYAQLAAEASVEAAVQNKFWEFHNRLLDNQDLLTFNDLMNHAEDVHLDTIKLHKALKARTHRDVVNRGKTTARAAGITGTPSFYLNGRKLNISQLEVELAEIIEHIKSIKQSVQAY